jgi:putative membrane protein
MEKNPYQEIPNSQLILRDKLAIDRTLLANERTLLAYMRTSLALLITGAGLIKFIDAFAIQVFGWGFIFISIVIFVFGLFRYKTTKKKYKELTDQDR